MGRQTRAAGGVLPGPSHDREIAWRGVAEGMVHAPECATDPHRADAVSWICVCAISPATRPPASALHRPPWGGSPFAGHAGTGIRPTFIVVDGGEVAQAPPLGSAAHVGAPLTEKGLLPRPQHPVVGLELRGQIRIGLRRQDHQRRFDIARASRRRRLVQLTRHVPLGCIRARPPPPATSPHQPAAGPSEQEALRHCSVRSERSPLHYLPKNTLRTQRGGYRLPGCNTRQDHRCQYRAAPRDLVACS